MNVLRNTEDRPSNFCGVQQELNVRFLSVYVEYLIFQDGRAVRFFRYIMQTLYCLALQNYLHYFTTCTDFRKTSFSSEKISRTLKLTTHFYLMSSKRMRGGKFLHHNNQPRYLIYRSIEAMRPSTDPGSSSENYTLNLDRDQPCKVPSWHYVPQHLYTFKHTNIHTYIYT